MSSPRKKLKLTPKDTNQKSGYRLTQESKVTSTPQRSSRRHDSPDISTISFTSSNTRSSIRTRLSDRFYEGDGEHDDDLVSIGTEFSTSSLYSARSSEKSEVFEVEDFDAYIDQVPRIKYVGKIWKSYKPITDNTLYAQILNDPRSINETVAELLLIYTKKPEYAVCHLLKFCVDVCGFQHFVFDYNFKEDNSRLIIETMETLRVLSQEEVLINKGRYLFMEPKTNLSRLLKLSIYNFLQKLITYAHDRGILYDGFFNTHFFKFIRYMSFSHIRAIRHTGVIFASKILTALVMVYSKISDGALNRLHSENIGMQKQEINNYIEYLYFIFIKNCHLQENNIVHMKTECIQELCIWIKHFPKMFIDQLLIGKYLLRFLTDPSKEVRFASLEAVEMIVQMDSTLTVLRCTSPEFLESVGKRFYDVDYKVAMKAIHIYNILYKRDPSLISSSRFKMLLNLVFDKCYPIGKAASQFLINYLSSTETRNEVILLHLVKLSMEPGAGTKQLLVEGCLEHYPMLKNWELYIDLLRSNDLEVDLTEHLVELFAETFHQVLTGESTILREKPRKGQVNIADVLSISKYIPRFGALLEMYKDYPKVTVALFKILLLTKNTIWIEISNVKVLENICSKMEELFDYQHDEELLKKICETYDHLSNILNYKNHLKDMIENILIRYAENLVSDLTNLTENTKNTVLKVSALFTHFDLSKKLKWEMLYDCWGDVDETTTGNLLNCCKWFLIWSLKNLVGLQNPATQFPILTRSCREFTSTCFNMLQNLMGQPLHFKTYDCLCDFHITFMKTLNELTRSQREMERLKLTIDDNQIQHVFVFFLKNYVISNTSIPLFERRSYVSKYIDLINLDILPIECLANIYQYFYEYNREYGPIIEASLSNIAKSDENIFIMVVTYTLTMYYEDILRKYNTIDMTTLEPKNLNLLIKQFLNCKEFKNPDKKVTKIICFAINYSLGDASKRDFLYFLKNFVLLIAENSNRKEILDYIKEKMPQATEKNDALLFIASHLKNQKLGINLKKKPVTIPKQPKPKEKVKKAKTKEPIKKPRPAKKGIGKKTPVSAEDTTKKTKQQKIVQSETEISEDDLTIHDSESDDLEEFAVPLNDSNIPIF